MTGLSERQRDARNRALARAAHQAGGYMALARRPSSRQHAEESRKELEVEVEMWDGSFDSPGDVPMRLPTTTHDCAKTAEPLTGRELQFRFRGGSPALARTRAVRDAAALLLECAERPWLDGLHVLGTTVRDGVVVTLSKPMPAETLALVASALPAEPLGPDLIDRADSSYLDREFHKALRAGPARSTGRSAFRPDTFAWAFRTGMEVHGCVVLAMIALWVFGALSWDDANGIARFAMPIDFALLPLVLRYVLPAVRRSRAARRADGEGREETMVGTAVLAVALMVLGASLLAIPDWSRPDDLALTGLASSPILGIVAFVLISGFGRNVPEIRRATTPAIVGGETRAVRVAAPPDPERRLLTAAVGAEDRMRAALGECRRLVEISATRPDVADAAAHVRTHLASLADLHDRAAALGDDADRAALVDRLVSGVEALARDAADTRRGLARAAGDEFETELRYLAMRVADPLSPLP